ncbi:MAG: hypothetical protein OXF02_00070 [Simkaniaceae bacterium]|nr:hypothetical protein [Simkaniaceae bacterium]
MSGIIKACCECIYTNATRSLTFLSEDVLFYTIGRISDILSRVSNSASKWAVVHGRFVVRDFGSFCKDVATSAYKDLARPVGSLCKDVVTSAYKDLARPVVSFCKDVATSTYGDLVRPFGSFCKDALKSVRDYLTPVIRRINPSRRYNVSMIEMENLGNTAYRATSSDN